LVECARLLPPLENGDPNAWAGEAINDNSGQNEQMRVFAICKT
jgi:hypothetical protein